MLNSEQLRSGVMIEAGARSTKFHGCYRRLAIIVQLVTIISPQVPTHPGNFMTTRPILLLVPENNSLISNTN